jgi:hypothetical protein
MNSNPSPPDPKARGVHGSVIGSADLKRDLAHADLIRDLAHGREARRKLFDAIVRHVQRREAKGPAGDMMEQIRRDEKLCKLLVVHEEQSEIIGMMDFVSDLKIES